MTPEIVIAEGDMVAVRDCNWAKSVAEFQGVPPTGKEGILTSTDLYLIAHGQVKEQWFEADEPGQIDEFAAAAKALLPRAKPQATGLNSALVPGDRHTGKIVIVSNWESEAAGDAAEPMYQQAMREFGRFLAEPPTRERYEVLLEI